MAEERVQRRLAAILSADVAGYSRLMGADEEGTLARLKGHRRGLTDPKINEYRGRIVKTTGDGFLAEFASVIDALHCAVEIQRGMAECNAKLPSEQRIEFRLGLNVGDIVVDADDIYGDGVNVAARLEALAEPGGLCVSGRVQEDARGKIDLAFEDLGEQRLKNIAWPVRVHQVRLDSVRASSQPVSPIHDKRSIAVLPFTNMSGDPEQEYFSDGIADDIITDLSKISMLSVTARNTTFALKGKPIEIGHVARQLNVAHIVEGSVRKAGNRIRITAQLIDAKLGQHLWAERYDRDLDDVFAVQDEISHAIVDALKMKLAPVERASIGRRTTENVDAYQLYLMGRFYMRSQARHSHRMAADLFRRATQLDPDFARAWANLALAHSWLRTMDRSEATLADIEGFIATALRLDDKLAEAHAAHAELLLRHLDVKAAEAAARRAIELDPTLHGAHNALAEALRRDGKFEQAAHAYEASLPLNDRAWWSPAHGAWCYSQLGDLEAARRLDRIAIKRLEEAVTFDPDNAKAYSVGCDILRSLGEMDRAMEWANRALELGPHDWLTQYNVACFFVQMGDHERGLKILDRCAPHFSREQFNWMRRDPDFDLVRNHPRYLVLVEREQARWSRTTS
jgi:adenylate cyclase